MCDEKSGRSSTSYRGFTLAEILIVLAIVALLAAVLFPVITRARQNERRSECLSNTKELSVGVIGYAQDYNGVFPCGNSYKAGKGWAGQIFPYVKSTAVFKCPDDPTPPTSWQGRYSPISYGYNRAVTMLPDGTPKMCSLSTLRAPAKSVLFFEIVNNDARLDNPQEADSCTGFGNLGLDGFGAMDNVNKKHCLAATGYMGDPPVTADPTSPTHLAAIRPEGRHNGGSNFVLSDGHARWLLPGQVSPGINARKPTDPQGATSTFYGYANFPSAAGTDVPTFVATFSNN